ncbi:MAG: hypothetical protein IT162_03910 [Bryobacterales bacterium]|nr:hypothetical protein [Bryobacterales bacterium]
MPYTRLLAAAFVPAVFMLLCAAGGTTTRIRIDGPDLIEPIIITDDAARFHVWTGPGTSTNEPQSLIADWAAGPATPPKDQPVYRVTFDTDRRERSQYVVFYVLDAATARGYVYVPGAGHPAYRDNTWLIRRGNEGGWYRAWADWEQVAHPLLARAPKIR